MRINTNVSALEAWRVNHNNNQTANKSLEKLSSGQRINKAGDDAAGLAISEKMRGQVRGLHQANRNLQDGISLLQTADGALTEVHSLLQRGREIAVQANNDTLTISDRSCLQLEVDQIVKDIDRIANNTQFNTINLLNQAGSASGQQAIIDGLKSAWLQQSEQLITNYYGITGDGVTMQVNLIQGTPGGVLAFASGNDPGTGKWNNVSLNIELADFLPGSLPNGANNFSAATGMYDDRIIAHEMTHAVMSRTMNFDNLPTWFNEGAAEAIHGADERLWGDSAGGTNFAAVAGELVSWEGTSADYSAGYAAVRYLHAQIKAAGGTGIKDVMTYLNANQADTLDQALAAIQTAHPALTFNNTASFVTQFTTGAGAAFMATMNLANTDTGAIGGLDADGGPIRTATSVVPDTVNYTNTPLAGFNVIWPTIQNGTLFGLQIGANSGNRLDFYLVNVQSAQLGLAGVDVANQASSAINQFDTAIATVSSERSRLGAIQNRLEHAINANQYAEENTTASESRIRDVDMAREMSSFVKNNMLSQASMSMLAQANQQPQNVLQLLRAG